MILRDQNHLISFFANLLGTTEITWFTFAVGCNAKSFASTLLLFFFSLCSVFFVQAAKNFYNEGSKISYQGAVWRRSDPFPGHTKSFFLIVSQVVIWDACGLGHGSFMVARIPSIQKSKINGQRLGNKLAS